MEPCLFVYGTLKSEFRNRWARLLRKHAVLIGPAEAGGRLYRLSTYPAMRIRSRSTELVKGELWRMRSGVDLLNALDGYEGRQYRRISTLVRCDGKQVLAQIYVWRWPLPESRRVASGLWEHKRRMEGGGYPAPGFIPASAEQR